MNVPEWSSRVDIEVVLVSCLTEVLSKVTDEHVELFRRGQYSNLFGDGERVRPIEVNLVTLFDVEALRRLPLDSRKAIRSDFRRVLYREPRAQLIEAYPPEDADCPEPYVSKDAVPLANALYLRWFRVYVALSVILNLEDEWGPM